MIFWSLCAFIWFRNMKKMLLQMTSVSLQPVPSLPISVCFIDIIDNSHSIVMMYEILCGNCVRGV
jgi:hypothetical protein